MNRKFWAAAYSSVVGVPIMDSSTTPPQLVASVLPSKTPGVAIRLASAMAAAPSMLDALRKVAAHLDQGRAIALTAEEAREVREAIRLAEDGE